MSRDADNGRLERGDGYRRKDRRSTKAWVLDK